MRQQRQGERGFTVIETTISLLVMMIVGLGTASLFIYSVRNNTGAAARTQAIAYAQQMMERVRHLDYHHAMLEEGVTPWTCRNGECTPSAAPALLSGSGGLTTPRLGYDSYSMTMNVEMVYDADPANVPRKRIAMELRPNLGGLGDDADDAEYWANHPVRVVMVRSALGGGLYRQ